MFTQKELFMSSPIHENELLETGIHEKIEQLLELCKIICRQRRNSHC